MSNLYVQFEEEFPYEDIECNIDQGSRSSDAEYEKYRNSFDDSHVDEPLFDRYIDPIPEATFEEDLQLQPSQDTSAIVLGQENDEKYLSEELLSDIEFEDEYGDDEERRSKRRIRFPQFNEALGFKDVSFEVGMEFRNLDVFKKAAKDYSVSAGVEVKLVKNDTKRCRAKCKDPCPWVLMCSWSPKLNSFQVKTYVNKHTCSRTLKTRQASSKWLAVKLLGFLRINAKPSHQDVLTYISDTFCVTANRCKAWRACKMAKTLMEGSEKKQYKQLREYCWEILRSNPGSKCQLGVSRLARELPPCFDRLYMCIKAVKLGFLAGCRPMIGLDGCFLKGYYGGQLLCAVGQDGNNAFYPIAIAVVQIESKDTWTWFLGKLLEDIGLSKDGINWSFIFDRQKGLVPAIVEIFPNSEHRFCVYHIYHNYAKQFKGKELKNLLWRCAKSTTMCDFERNLDVLKRLNDKAWEYLSKIPPKQWSRAAFETSSKSEVVTNNMCEQFNSKILVARGKPIITMLEEIRIYIMKKMIQQRNLLERFKGHLCPRVRSKLEENKQHSRIWVAEWVGDPNGEKFEVSCKPDKFVVDLAARTCSCRSWDLCGIPCPHSIAAIGWRHMNPEDFVHSSLTKDTYIRLYEYHMQPVNGPNLWCHIPGEELKPPQVKKKRGRKKTQRKKDKEAETQQPVEVTKLKRRSTPTCKKCGVVGHNQRSCKKQSIGRLQKLPVKRGPSSSGI